MKTGQKGRDLIKFYEGLPKQIVKENKQIKKVVVKDEEGKDITKDEVVITKTTAYPPYMCPAGYPTLGYGSRFHANGKEVTMKDSPITLQECEDLLTSTLGRYEKAVMEMVTVPLTQNQFDALVDFAYNLGEGNLKASTLLKYLNQRNYSAAADQFLVWNKARVNGSLVAMPGLTKRREAERKLFLTR